MIDEAILYTIWNCSRLLLVWTIVISLHKICLIIANAILNVVIASEMR